MLTRATSVPMISTYCPSLTPSASRASYHCRVSPPASFTTAWITSTAAAGRSVAVVWLPLTVWGESAALRSRQYAQSRAARASAAIATRSVPVHHAPGAPSRSQNR